MSVRGYRKPEAASAPLPRFPASVAAQDVNMGPARAFKHPGDEDVVCPEAGAADRADSVPFPVEAVYAAPYMHEPVLPPGKRRKNQGFYQFSRRQFDGTYRAGLRGAGVAFARGLPPAPPPRSSARKHTDSGPYKQGIPEPEQDGAYDGKG
jgi:hypothetical protein